MKRENKFAQNHIITILLLALVQFSVVLDFAILAPLGEIMIKDLNINTKQFGVLVSIYAFSAAISVFVSADFADMWGRKINLGVIYTGFIAGTFLCAFANSYSLLFLARIVTGIFGGITMSIVQTIVSGLFDDKFRNRVEGYIQMVFSVGQIIGIPLGLFLATKLNWHSTFLFIVGIGTINLLFILFKIKPITAHLLIKKTSSSLNNIFLVFRTNRYIMSLLAVAFIAVGGFMMVPFMTLYAVNNLGISRERVPIIFMASGFSNLVIMPIVGKLSNKWSRYRVFLIGSIFAIITANIYTHLPIVSLAFLIPFNILMFGSIMMRITPFNAMNIAIPNKEDRDSYLSLTSAIQQTGGGVGAILSGYVITLSSPNSPLQHMDILGYILSIIFFICVILVFRVSKLSVTN
jgi:predicted MFS family arabinose efflux permease